MRKQNKKGLFIVSAIMAGSLMAMSGCGASGNSASVAESEPMVQASEAVPEESATETVHVPETVTQTETEAETETAIKTETETVPETKTETETEGEQKAEPESSVQKAPAAEGSVSAGDYSVTIGGLLIPLGDDMRNYAGLLSEPDAYSAARSCTEDGDDKVYTYGGTTIYTYITNGADIISLIEITGSEYLPSGIHVGSTKEEVIAAYGSAYIEEGTELLYEMGNKTIGLQMTDNKVSFIELFGQ